MAPKKSKVTTASKDSSDATRSESQSIDASQSQEASFAKLSELSQTRDKKIKERRDKKKTDILANHEARQQKLKRDIEKCLKEHDERVRKIRRPKIQHLLDLALQRRTIEQKIEKCQYDLQTEYLNTANQLQIALDGRINELDDN